MKIILACFRLIRLTVIGVLVMDGCNGLLFISCFYWVFELVEHDGYCLLQVHERLFKDHDYNFNCMSLIVMKTNLVSRTANGYTVKKAMAKPPVPRPRPSV